MIYLPKSDGATLQPLLEAAKIKDDATVYCQGPVYQQLKIDFHGKCYLCEDNEVTSIQIEHFEPHKNDLAKKYVWHNLFYACGHCNNIKGVEYWPLLNCTDAADRIWESIEIRFIPFPKATVEIVVSPSCPKPQAGENTRRLMEKIFTGKGATAMKIDEAAVLRQKWYCAEGYPWVSWGIRRAEPDKGSAIS